MRVGHDAPDEVRVRGVERGQEGVQLGLEGRGHRLERLVALALLLAPAVVHLLGLAWVKSRILATFISILHNTPTVPG